MVGLDIRPDDATFAENLAGTLELARKFKLSAYDASYLALAMRLHILLATLDEDLRKAAKKAGVKKMQALKIPKLRQLSNCC